MKGVVAVLVLLLLLNLGLISVAVAAAVFGLWAVTAMDLLVLLIVVVGMRMAFPARRAVLTYREIMEMQGRPVPVEERPEPVPVEETKVGNQPEISVAGPDIVAVAAAA